MAASSGSNFSFMSKTRMRPNTTESARAEALFSDVLILTFELRLQGSTHLLLCIPSHGCVVFSETMQAVSHFRFHPAIESDRYRSQPGIERFQSVFHLR